MAPTVNGSQACTGLPRIITDYRRIPVMHTTMMGDTFVDISIVFWRYSWYRAPLSVGCFAFLFLFSGPSRGLSENLGCSPTFSGMNVLYRCYICPPAKWNVFVTYFYTLHQLTPFQNALTRLEAHLFAIFDMGSRAFFRKIPTEILLGIVEQLWTHQYTVHFDYSS